MTTVCTSLDDMKPMPIPEDFRKRFEDLLETEA
jgi:acyl-CoA thioesterase FadM